MLSILTNPSVIAFIGVVIGSYLTYKFGIRSQIIISDHQKRQQIFSQIMGRKFLTTQLYVSRFEASIHSDYHEAKWKLAGYPVESIDLQEAQRWMHKSEDLVFNIAESNQILFELIGLVRILFPDTDKLNNLIMAIYHFKMPSYISPFNLDSTELEDWKVKTKNGIQMLVENEYGKAIDDLLNYLSEKIRK